MDLIYAYTREQAIQDGVLIDVSELAKDVGFRIPVAITATAWNTYIVPDENAIEHGESENGRMWDALQKLRYTIRKSKQSTNEILFEFFVDRDGGLTLATLKAHIGPGDRGEPVLTLMMPNED
ncbi:hypothetical protein DNHGIG_40490 [Collibacillus ludicampi]|uniref:Uncharacterized protein n=1 Tax=Collibacillus ludicampi TaxID=2771369 RepID=A0AAV4LKS7_9BACL|nr:DUF6573 family protein [Collibacillus ludicampi]GIM48500.1 hypothetical protein DNHGIG_40490 [Collibacillus ludicampi]